RPGADDPGGSVIADADIDGLAIHPRPAAAGPPVDGVGRVDHPRAARLVHVDAHGSAADALPAGAVPARDVVAAVQRVRTDAPQLAFAGAANAQVVGLAGHRVPAPVRARRLAARGCVADRLDEALDHAGDAGGIERGG